MARLISVFISASHQNAIAALLWLGMFVLTLGLAGWISLHQLGEGMAAQANTTLQEFVRLRLTVASTFAALRTEVTAAPCSPEFHQQMRKVAYLPDGLNEFLYTANDAVHCSVDRDFATPLVLGPSDITRDEPTVTTMWLDRSLEFLGLAGLTGSIIVNGDFAVIVPPQDVEAAGAKWMRQEVTIHGPDDAWWHRGGQHGLYDAATAAAASWLPIVDGALHRRTCDTEGYHCVVTQAGIGDIVRLHSAIVAVIVAGCGLLAGWLAGWVHALLRRYWAFEARFRRRFSADTVCCVYQPIMELASGAITGCEVLVRWRDIDGSLVAPDRFLDIVEQHKLTMRLTRYIVERAREELAAAVPADLRFQVNFNIFPCDLEATALLELFAAFDDVSERFELVVEIVESAALDLEAAQREIEALRQAGIRTYLDDFGTGHSNIHHLAALSLDGVKLDRGFAMAPDESLMGQMLGNAIHLVHVSGRAMVIEGVESEERLAMLRATGKVDFVQGYLISRPLAPEPFAAFLARHRAGQLPRLVA